MAKKIVRYNGGTETYYGCSDHKVLVIGQKYEVIGEKDLGFQTNYTLKGVEGEFNALWFNEAEGFIQTYLAVSHSIPVAGRSYECSKLEGMGNRWHLQLVTTSTVVKVEQIALDTFSVTTLNSIYIVKVN